MERNSTHTGNGMESQPLRWGRHKRVQHCVSFVPDLHDWLTREMVASKLSFSEVVNRELKKQHDLREQLSALTGKDAEEQTPVFQVLLEQHGQKVSKTIDGAVKQIGEQNSALKVIGAMVEMFARIAMSPEQFNRWERGVFGAERSKA
jgi:hypothetical protein